jgi:hypothetical protein
MMAYLKGADYLIPADDWARSLYANTDAIRLRARRALTDRHCRLLAS